MRPNRYVTGLALLSSGCAFDSLYVTAREPDPIAPEPVPPLVVQVVPPSGEVMAEWELPPTNPWFRYFKFTLLSALDAHEANAELPDVEQLDVVRRARCAAASLAAAGLPPDTMWIADLRGAASVAFGSTLSQKAPAGVSLVLTFNNWPAEHELVPAEETLAALVSMPPLLPSQFERASPVFLLDSWRLAYRDEEPADGWVDNRYMLSPADLPDAATLRQQGIARLVYLVEDRVQTPREEDDLHERFMEYQEAGIAISLFDLGAACDLPAEGERLLYAETRIQVTARDILVPSGNLFRRSPGGFGGRHAVPAPVGGRTGAGWMGGGGFGG